VSITFIVVVVLVALSVGTKVVRLRSTGRAFWWSKSKGDG
jgi:hypothetical protein